MKHRLEVNIGGSRGDAIAVHEWNERKYWAECMTVSKLIEFLNGCDPSARVAFRDRDYDLLRISEPEICAICKDGVGVIL